MNIIDFDTIAQGTEVFYKPESRNAIAMRAKFLAKAPELVTSLVDAVTIAILCDTHIECNVTVSASTIRATNEGLYVLS